MRSRKQIRSQKRMGTQRANRTPRLESFPPPQSLVQHERSRFPLGRGRALGTEAEPGGPTAAAPPATVPAESSAATGPTEST